MCHSIDITTAIPLAADDVLPFVRAASAAAAAPEPPRRLPGINVAADEAATVQAMIGLASMAAEGLPAPHAGEFGALLEVVHRKLGDVLSVLHGAGQTAAAPREA